MFVKTVDSLDDYAGIPASKLDADSIDAALIEAAKRATKMEPSQTAYVEFTRPPRFERKLTETVHLDVDLDDFEGLCALEIKNELRRTAVDIVHQVPHMNDGEINANSVTLRPTGECIVLAPDPSKVSVRYVVKNARNSDTAFDTYEEAFAFVQHYASSSRVDITGKVIRPYFYMGYGQFTDNIEIDTISSSYDAEVTIKMPITDETPLYIVFGG